MSDLTLQTPVPETPANTSAARVPSDSLPGLKGMWVAVCLEYLEFTMFFSVYFVARWFHPQAFQEGAARLWTWGGVAVTLPTAAYRLVKDTHRPRIVPAGMSLPSPGVGGLVEVVFTAGFGPAWSDVPHDLAQAVFLLAAQFHENRHDASDRPSVLPFGVMALIERWRTVRVLGGGQA